MPRELGPEAWAALRLARGRVTPPPGEAGAILLGYQVRLNEATRKHEVTFCEKSRRIGATWGAAAESVVRSGARRDAGGMDTLYIGTSFDMAKEFIDTAADWAKAFAATVKQVGEFLFDDESEEGIKAFRIDFASGFSVVALSSRPRSLRGRQGFVVIDEGAFADDLPALLQAAIALTMWGGRVLVISTHYGADNPFARAIEDARAGKLPYGVVRIDLDDALMDGLYERICLRTGRDWTPEGEAEWRAALIKRYGEGADEELYCIPSQSGGTVIPGPLVEACSLASVPVFRLALPDGFKHEPDASRRARIEDWCEEHLRPVLASLERGLPSSFGGDFGRVTDLTVYWPLVTTRTLMRHTPMIVELRNAPFAAQRQVGFYICDRLPRLSGVKLDAIGIGAQLAEEFAERYGPHVVEEVKLSAPWYVEHVPAFRAAFEDGTITVPRDLDIKGDLTLPKFKGGVPSIPPVRIKASDGKTRHGDAFVAGLLAYTASRLDPVAFDYTPMSALRPAARDDDDIPGRDGPGRRALW